MRKIKVPNFILSDDVAKYVSMIISLYKNTNAWSIHKS